MRDLRTPAQGLERCSRDNNGEEECRTVPKGLRRCFRCSAGVTGFKTVIQESPDVFAAYNGVIEPGMLPKTLRHRFHVDNFKDFLGCLTLNSGQWSVVGPRVFYHR